MKKLIIALLLSLPLMTMAKVSDFNILINSNSAEETQLNKEVQTQVGSHQVTRRNASEGQPVVEMNVNSQFMETNPDLLRVQKEIVRHEVNDKDSDKRIANEFKSSDVEF